MVFVDFKSIPQSSAAMRKYQNYRWAGVTAEQGMRSLSCSFARRLRPTAFFTLQCCLRLACVCVRCQRYAD
jgi:hypothetical protein